MTRCRNRPSLLMAIALAMACTPALAQDHHRVSYNGRVMDSETELDGIRKVGSRAGKTAVITEAKSTGKATIDATGPAVAPDPIDTQFHAQEEACCEGERHRGWKATR